MLCQMEIKQVGEVIYINGNLDKRNNEIINRLSLI
jgi:hypothetical protein